MPACDDGSKIFTTNLEGQVSVYDAQTMEVITQKPTTTVLTENTSVPMVLLCVKNLG